MNINDEEVSFIIPAKNEEGGLSLLLPTLKARYPLSEILVVDDGSTDSTAAIAINNGARVVSHPYSKGNGAAIKTGARCATGDYFVFMDADGQHRPEDVDRLIQGLRDGNDMVVGARWGFKSQAGLHRAIANKFYNHFASWMTGHKVCDLTSGFRAVCGKKFKQFIWMLPNGFSYPTTITMAFFRTGYSLAYIPIETDKRLGASHLRVVRDGLRFLLIILKIGTLYSPFKIFLPVSSLFFLAGLGNYFHTYASYGRFTNMSALMFVASILVFLIGLVSEQITTLQYKDSDVIDQ